MKKAINKIENSKTKKRSNVPTFQQKRFSIALYDNNILKINNIYIGVVFLFCWNALCFVGTAIFYYFFCWNRYFGVPTIIEKYFDLINRLLCVLLERWNVGTQNNSFQKLKKSFHYIKIHFKFVKI